MDISCLHSLNIFQLVSICCTYLLMNNSNRNRLNLESRCGGRNSSWSPGKHFPFISLLIQWARRLCSDRSLFLWFVFLLIDAETWMKGHLYIVYNSCRGLKGLSYSLFWFLGTSIQVILLIIMISLNLCLLVALSDFF
jgi:hypothetical protein